MAMIQFLRDGKGSTVIKYILMTLLVLAVGGLVLTDVGGFFRDGVSTNDVARVGDDSISIITFDNTLRRRLASSEITPQMAYQYGLTEQILNSEIQTYLLKQAAEESGIELSKKEMAQVVGALIADMTAPGESPADALQRLLRGWGLSEQRFLELIERDAKAAYMTQLVSAGFVTMPDALVRDLYAYQNETRAVELIIFPHKDVTNFEEPSEERMRNFYEAQKQRFVIPETRDVQILKVSADTIKKDITVDEAEAKAIYEDNAQAYDVPEQRHIRQAVYESKDAAQAAYQRIQDGQSFDEATANAQTTLDEDVTKDQLMAGLSDAGFSLEKGESSAPLKTPLGWHILKVESISEGKSQSYEEVKAQIINELKENALIDQMTTIANELDDALAAGTPPQEIQNMELDVEEIKGITQNGADKLAQYAESAQEILSNTFELYEGESSPVIENDARDLLAVRLVKITPQSYKPYEDVKDDIRIALRAANQRAANQAAVDKLITGIKAGDGKSLDAVAREQNKYLQKFTDLKRGGEPEEPLNAQALQQIFGASTGAVINTPVQNGIAVIKITKAELADPDKADAQALEEIASQLENNARQEALTLLVNDEQEGKTVQINRRRLQSAYGSEAGQ